MSYNYNTSATLWQSFRESEPSLAVCVVDAYIHAAGHGFLARFDSDASASACLIEAGYVRISDKWYMPGKDEAINAAL